MKIVKHLFTVGLTTSLIIGCHKNENKTADSTQKENIQKEVAATQPQTASFTINGMTCAIGCAKTIEDKLSKMEGVQNAKVDFDKKQATVEFDAAVLTPEKLTKEVESAGDGETYKVSNMVTNKKA